LAPFCCPCRCCCSDSVGFHTYFPCPRQADEPLRLNHGAVIRHRCIQLCPDSPIAACPVCHTLAGHPASASAAARPLLSGRLMPVFQRVCTLEHQYYPARRPASARYCSPRGQIVRGAASVQFQIVYPPHPVADRLCQDYFTSTHARQISTAVVMVRNNACQRADPFRDSEVLA